MRAELQHRTEQLSREIRCYPTPIARCDEQLTGLIEERAKLLQQLSEIQEQPDGA
jgi:chorismate mutase